MQYSKCIRVGNGKQGLKVEWPTNPSITIIEEAYNYIVNNLQMRKYYHYPYIVLT